MGLNIFQVIIPLFFFCVSVASFVLPSEDSAEQLSLWRGRQQEASNNLQHSSHLRSNRYRRNLDKSGNWPAAELEEDDRDGDADNIQVNRIRRHITEELKVGESLKGSDHVDDVPEKEMSASPTRFRQYVTEETKVYDDEDDDELDVGGSNIAYQFDEDNGKDDEASDNEEAVGEKNREKRDVDYRDNFIAGESKRVLRRRLSKVPLLKKLFGRRKGKVVRRRHRRDEAQVKTQTEDSDEGIFDILKTVFETYREKRSINDDEKPSRVDELNMNEDADENVVDHRRKRDIEESEEISAESENSDEDSRVLLNRFRRNVIAAAQLLQQQKQHQQQMHQDASQQVSSYTAYELKPAATSKIH